MAPDEVWELVDADRPAYDDPQLPRPIRVHLWRPRPATMQAGVAPVVALSHGTGACGPDMEWLAAPLAELGFLAVAVDHHGNNWIDGYLPQAFTHIWERPRDISVALDHVASRVGLDWVGAAGFSAGGYTAAALAGVRLRAAAIEGVATGALEVPELPEYPTAVAWLRANTTAQQAPQVAARAAGDWADPRVRAAFLICPGDGGLAQPASLSAVGVPVAIRWGGGDVIAPPALTALPYLAGIPGAVGADLGPSVEHEDLFAANPRGLPVREAVAQAATAFFCDQFAGHNN